MSGNRPPTLQDIADKTGYGLSTVSLAMRHSASLRQATRERIQKAAEELGYKPNPLISALMSQVRDKRRRRQEQIALISRFKNPITHAKTRASFYLLIYQSLLEHAAAKNYSLDEFPIGNGELSASRLSDILKARGITGVVFFPGSSPNTPTAAGFDYPELEWENFATVVIGFSTKLQGLQQVVSDYSYDLDCALERTRAAGLQRVGLAVEKMVDLGTNHSWSARFLYYQHGLSARRRVPLLLSEAPDQVMAWFTKHRPEVILIAGDRVQKILLENNVRIPEDVRLINLLQRGEPGLAGIDPHTSELGHAAVEALSALLQSNRLGLLDYPSTIAIKGRWVAGKSFPE